MSTQIFMTITTTSTIVLIWYLIAVWTVHKHNSNDIKLLFEGTATIRPELRIAAFLSVVWFIYLGYCFFLP